MKIVLNEMKKIWNWKIIGLILIMAYLFYFLFMSYPIEHFRNNHPNIEHHDLTVEMTERFGPQMTAEEFEAFIIERASLNELDFEAYIATIPYFQETGISTYEEYQDFLQNIYESNEELTEEEIKAVKAIEGHLAEDAYFIASAIDSMKDTSINFQGPEESALSGYTFEMTRNYIIYFAILTLLLSLILISPLIVGDRMRNIHFIQYTSKNGRKILNQQLFAAIISTFLLTTISLVIFGGLFLQNDVLALWDNNVNSFLNSFLGELWVQLTFGEYIIIFILFTYTLNLMFTLLAFLASRFSQNLITLIIKLIPAFALGTVYINLLFNQLFTPLNKLYRLTNLVGTEAILTLGLLLGAFFITIFTLRREKNIDIY